MIARSALNPFVWLLASAAALAPVQVSAQASGQEDRVPKMVAEIYLPKLSPEELEQARRQAEQDARSCEQKDFEACKRLGDAYSTGRGVEPIEQIATILYQQACDAAVGDACAALGSIHAYSWLTPGEMSQGDVDQLMEQSQAHLAMARIFWGRACALRSLAGCHALAEHLLDSTSGASDPAEAQRIAEKNCREGYSDSCLLYANTLAWNDETGEGAEQARELLDATCRNGHLASCNRVVSEILASEQVDQARFNEFLSLQCAADYEPGCRDFAERAFLGEGMEPDRELALEYYAKACAIGSWFCAEAEAVRDEPALRVACQAGDEASCARLGHALSTNPSPIFDPEEAYSLLLNACDKGDSLACYAAAGTVDYLPQVPSEQAMLLIEKACDGEVPSACYQLVRNLLNDDGTAKDEHRVARLYTYLCEEGFEEGCLYAEQYAGLYPEVAITTADQRYTKPYDPSEIDQRTPRERAMASVVEDGCTYHSAEFRGQLYEEIGCDYSPRAIGGYMMQPGQAPWQALLWRPEELNGQELSAAQRVLCGGTLIAKGWILTAAHCLVDLGNKVTQAGHKVRLGVFNPRNDEGVSYPIIRTIRPGEFDRPSLLYDIALVQYDPKKGVQEGPTNKIAALALDSEPIEKRRIEPGMEVFAYGWGWTAEQQSASTDYLQGVKMVLRSQEECAGITNFEGEDRDSAICAAGAEGAQTCYGDSGGGLVYYGDKDRRPKVLAVVSGGRKCGTTGIASQYTRVAKVQQWIADMMAKYDSE